MNWRHIKAAELTGLGARLDGGDEERRASGVTCRMNAA